MKKEAACWPLPFFDGFRMEGRPAGTLEREVRGVYEAYEVTGAMARLLEENLAAGEFFEHLSDEQRGALLQSGCGAADFASLLERAARGRDAAEF